MKNPGTKIRFELTQDEEGYPPVASELLWAKPIGGNVYRLDNTPFFVLGSSLNDEVMAVELGGELVFRRTVRWGGHRTVRLLISERADVPTLRDELRRMGCGSELNSDGILVAVDVPPLVSSATFKNFLDLGSVAGRFEYEEGNVNW